MLDWGLQSCIHSPHKEEWTEEQHTMYKCLFGLCLPWRLRQPMAAKLPRPTAPSKVQEQLLPDSGASPPIASFLFRSASVLILFQTHPHIYIQFPWINILLFLSFQVLWWAQENCFSSSCFIYHPPCPWPTKILIMIISPVVPVIGLFKKKKNHSTRKVNSTKVK